MLPLLGQTNNNYNTQYIFLIKFYQHQLVNYNFHSHIQNDIIFFLGDQPEVELEVIDGLKNDGHDGSMVLVPQYRYKLGFPILIPRMFWPKLELITEDDEIDEEKSVFQDFDLVDFLISSEIEIKKINFNFLEPIDYDEEKDF